ncbi:MAG: apolipoprotein N-acyltransferase, partial [Methylobacteriaceae bacterium]|nr:apolipoprotein N-acyltransferase [Methylobacteriaceae bacterium]
PASGAKSLFASLRRAAGAGWWWGFGYFLAGLWWLGAAFLVEADKFAWALPLGVVGLPMGLALFPALGFAAARLFWSPGGPRVLALAAGLGGAEWLRGVVLTGFPWNAVGMAFGGNVVLAQTAALLGLWGLTLIAIAICAAPATLADPGRRALARSPVAVALAALTAMIAYGGLRLAGAGEASVPGVRLRLMQPALPQDAKFRPENRDAILARYLDLSDRATSAERTGVADVTHLLWPESAFPFLLSRDAAALSRIASALKGGAVLVTGAARQDEQSREYFNSIQTVGGDGAILSTYDKTHLVPFGEYMPFGRLLRAIGLTQFVHIPGGFAPGARRRLLDVPGLPPVAPLICYEAIFSGAATPPAAEGARRAGVMLNVTNDAWFGVTPGPYQHLAQARLRTIEEGLPMIRVANSGVSAVIGPYGVVVAALPLGVADVLDAALPKAVEPPLFARIGHWGAAVLGLLFLLGAALGRLQR